MKVEGELFGKNKSNSEMGWGVEKKVIADLNRSNVISDVNRSEYTHICRTHIYKNVCLKCHNEKNSHPIIQ
jgi:hypothetical protein